MVPNWMPQSHYIIMMNMSENDKSSCIKLLWVFTLYRHQVGQGYHLHWETASQVLDVLGIPTWVRYIKHTQACQFDMLQSRWLYVTLRPNSRPRKGMTVFWLPIHLCTITYMAWHCNHQHVHQPLEGVMQTKTQPAFHFEKRNTQNHTPEKFARDGLWKCLIKGGKTVGHSTGAPGHVCVFAQQRRCLCRIVVQ